MQTRSTNYFGIPYNSIDRMIFLYMVALLLVVLVLFVINRLLRMPMGRAWEALREDEIACRALGLNPTASNFRRSPSALRLPVSPVRCLLRDRASSAPNPLPFRNPLSCWLSWCSAVWAHSCGHPGGYPAGSVAGADA
jgi:Tfp pilus assembly protein PilX